MQYLCGGYDRLSDADNKNDESSSIQSQKLIIDSFAKFSNLTIVKHYVDDGFSGGNFDRPGFQEMIKDIEAGKINCVITKDLSRLGREMYTTGNYIEQYFLEHGVRYIAINDSYDSNIGDTMLGLRLGVNDLYLRDVSKKVKTSFRAKQNRGDYIGSLPLYGYLKDPEDKHKLVVDEEIRPIIKMIYELALDDVKPQKIAEILTIKKIPIPIIYKKEIRGKNINENDGNGIWKRQTIKSILTNQMYIGNMVQNTYNKVSYNSKKIRKTRDEERIIVPNTHEGIIEKKDFDLVQKKLEESSNDFTRTHNPSKVQSEYLLGGLLYCHECGRLLGIYKDVLKKSVRHYTQCNLYIRKGKFGVCTSHRINYDWLEEDIIEHLQNVCEEFCKYYDFNETEDNSSKIVLNNIKDLNVKIEKTEKEIKISKATIDNLYLDKVKGIVSEEMYERIFNKTKNELELLKTKLKEYQRTKDLNFKEDEDSSFNRCKSAVLSYMSLRKPTHEQLKRLINRIEVDKDKNVYVYLRFKDMSVLKDKV